MNTKHILLTVSLALLLGTSLAQAQSISWFSVDGGGGASSNSRFSLNGTIGQPATALLVSQAASVQGGFWSAPIQESPELRLFRNGGFLVIAWPANAVGFQLQTSAQLTPANWRDVSVAPATIGNENWAVVLGTDHHQFFRLRKP